MLRLNHTWPDDDLEHRAGGLCSALPPQTSLSPARRPQENTPDADFQRARPPLTSPDVELIHILHVSSQTLEGWGRGGGVQTFQRGVYPRVCTPALASESPPSAGEALSEGSLTLPAAQGCRGPVVMKEEEVKGG